MNESIVSLAIRLEIGTKKEGTDWIACCLPLDLFSQGTTKDQSIASLKEAVSLWFESCIERGVLEQALAEAGFKHAKDGEAVPENASVVHLHERRRGLRPKVTPRPRYITVSIPAYTAGRQIHAGAAR